MPDKPSNKFSGDSMKKAIVLLGICFAVSLQAQIVEKALVEDYIPITNKESAFEIKTKIFDQVVLDCGGYAGWMTFYKKGKVAYNIYLDTYGDCPNMNDYLSKSKENKLPVCLQLEGKGDKSKLTVSNEEADCL